MTDALLIIGAWWLLILGGWLLLRWVLGQIVPDDSDPDEWIREAQQGLIDPNEEEKP